LPGRGQKGSKTEIKADFEIAVFTVTQGQWRELMGNNPSRFSRDGGGKDKVKEIKDEDLKQFPVDTVSWGDAQTFIKKLNEQEKGKGWLYRLPTEAEWEYACRGGATSEDECSYDFYFAKPTNDLSSKEANINGRFFPGEKGTYLERTTKVGSYAPNKLGLYDMHGNVLQWCEDPFDPKAGDSYRVLRGGCWGDPAMSSIAGHRGKGMPDAATARLGVRLARVPVEAKADPLKPKDGPLGMKFVPLPKATFYMGWDGKKKGVKTEIKEDFEIAIYTVTQEQWEKVMGTNPSFFSRGGEGKDKVKDIKDEDLKHFPVENVSWEDMKEFIKKLNEKEAKGGYVYRLPTEAEWEYACRGGATSEEDCAFLFYFDKPTNVLSAKQANFRGDTPLGRTTKVGSYAPNKLGLYDMHGNVWQRCEMVRVSPTASELPMKGGSHGNGDSGCTAAYHGRWGPRGTSSIGLRLVRVSAKSE
jgi:formylglycine-generating enzyme required for sulfatase activity